MLDQLELRALRKQLKGNNEKLAILDLVEAAEKAGIPHGVDVAELGKEEAPTPKKLLIKRVHPTYIRCGNCEEPRLAGYIQGGYFWVVTAIAEGEYNFEHHPDESTPYYWLVSALNQIEKPPRSGGPVVCMACGLAYQSQAITLFVPEGYMD